MQKLDYQPSAPPPKRWLPTWVKVSGGLLILLLLIAIAIIALVVLVLYLFIRFMDFVAPAL